MDRGAGDVDAFLGGWSYGEGVDGAPSDDCFNGNHLGAPLMWLMPVQAPSTPSP
jgi:hypothetical protein